MSGTRGPLTAVTSRRGERERRNESKAGEPVITMPERPDWLPTGAIGTWDAVIADLEAARVPLEHIDQSAIGMFVACVHGTSEAIAAGDLKLAARLNRDCLQWANAVGASPQARARLGIKPQQAARPSKWDRLRS